MLCQLSYAGRCAPRERVESMERETRIELATNSLEGCDSTIELLPPFLSILHCVPGSLRFFPEHQNFKRMQQNVDIQGEGQVVDVVKIVFELGDGVLERPPILL